MEEEEKYFSSPYSGETISKILDISTGSQKYIEDCEVCCHPIEIKIIMNGNCMEYFDASRTDI